MKTKLKRLFGILVGLVMVLGLMPGMSLTAYADVPQEGRNRYVGYRTGSNGFDVYGRRERADGTFEEIQTTYQNSGYTTVMKVGESGSIPFDNFAYGKEYTSNDVKASVTARVRGKSVLVTYTLVNNSNETTKTVKIGSYCDAQIGDDDKAPCSFTENGIKMTSIDGTLEFQLIPGGGDFTTRWYGYYYDAYDNVFNNQTDTSTFTNDSGIAWSWTINIPAGETVTKTAELSAGQAGTTQIIYDANGGTGEMDPTVDIPGESIKLNKNTFTKNNCVFQGWDTNSAGTTVVYADEYTLTMPDTDTTLYAVWKENTTYTVTYKVVGGTWSDGSTTDKTETVQSGSKPASVPSGMKASEGYTGGAWDTNPADATITGATTFTYTFTAIPTYTVTYKVVNGTWSDDSTTDKTETVQSGSKPASVPTGMKASQGFTGGAWDENPADATITGATTFTYTFTAIPTYTVTYKVVGGTWSDDSTTDKTETVQSGSKPASVPTGMKASEGYTGGAWDTNPADATITGATTFTYTFTAKQAATVTKAPTAKNLTYNGSAQELVTAGEATGGTMQYALGTATEATEQYTTSIPTATNAGTYYVWYKAKGDDDHLDSDPRCVTVYITNALYTVTSVENWEHTIDYPNDIIITVKRNTADNITYSMYTGASVDGNGIPADGSSVAQGSLILTLKGSYLDTLSTGTHKVTISFKDGSADATISIVNAPPAPTAAPTHVPKTGDGANLVLWIGLILLGFLGIIAFAGMAGRKHRNR